MINNAHSRRGTDPAHIGSSRNILTLFVLGTSVMYTIPITNVGMARMKANSRRNKSRCLSCSSIARDRSSIVGGWYTLALKALSSPSMAAMIVRIVMSGGWGVYVTLT